MITRMDRDIGSLVELLQTRGIDRQTLVMFVSDNGPHQEGGGDPVFFKSSGGLRGIKRDLYEGGIRVPMIARWTGTIPAGRVSDHVWAHWDMLPTLTQLAGVAVRHARRARRPVDGARAARRVAAGARFHVLGVSRTRLPAGRANGQLESGPPEEGRAARTLRPRHRSRGTARRRRRESGSGREDHDVPRVSANRIGSAGRSSNCRIGAWQPSIDHEAIDGGIGERHLLPARAGHRRRSRALVDHALADARRHASAWLPLRAIGVALLVVSVPVLVRAFWQFAVEGLGTPAPVAPTKRLVVGGLYRYVRNPMYLAVLGAIVGQALLLGQPGLLVYAMVILTAFVSFVRWYEEPTLRRQFGAEYDAYKKAVPAWWPRRHPWTPVGDRTHRPVCGSWHRGSHRCSDNGAKTQTIIGTGSSTRIVW